MMTPVQLMHYTMISLSLILFLRKSFSIRQNKPANLIQVLDLAQQWSMIKGAKDLFSLGGGIIDGVGICTSSRTRDIDESNSSRQKKRRKKLGSGRNAFTASSIN